MLRALAVIVVLAATASAAGAPTALAGGSWLDPVKDRYEPGESATLVGYVGPTGLVEETFHAYLYKQWTPDYIIHPRAMPLYVGDLEVSSTGDGGYLATRVAITFDLPDYLEPGYYWLEYCNEGCTDLLRDLISGWFAVGIDPEYPVSREWPRDEPEIANLADDALVSGPGWERTAAELRLEEEAAS